MKNTTLPQRAFNSPLIEFANFESGHINLIKLIKPYANGDSFAIHDTINKTSCATGLFKMSEVKIKFELAIKNASKRFKLIERDLTGN